MGASLRRLAEDHKDVISTNPRLDMDKMRATKYLQDFDREIQLGSWG